MNTFFNEYNSLSELYSSVLHGNEIEFRYGEKKYYILPYYVENNIMGVCFGEAYTEKEIVCLSEKELYNVGIENTSLGKVVSKIDIIWNNF